ncbi:MAG: type II secretion system F family protein, partial [Planctomycetales bacterium]|nr:type II secretion system F family protein [Planctomycetales bacterium]NIM08159.1 type II secretion system F family protein [Planctomycetales bacterium]NIN07656.1 type II secretion system F family protein [Planctomycetales bacterium]NIN76773.1 type II secretion system F family protein [Planctomycetales bacterium]NIO33982.1 type II secretion system F family protein [Planctomycetales bacterium]
MSLSYLYKARDPLGNIFQGTLAAHSVEEATQQLRRDGYHVCEIEEESGGWEGLFGKRISRNDVT